jgi:hypothetical protein
MRQVKKRTLLRRLRLHYGWLSASVGLESGQFHRSKGSPSGMFVVEDTRAWHCLMESSHQVVSRAVRRHMLLVRQPKSRF